MSKKFNYVYLTTNIINNKQYVGSHCTDNIDDNYLGSGRILIKAIKKYGKENFKRVVIEECEDASLARWKEGYYIEDYLTLDPSGYNLSPKGGIGFKGATHSDATRKKMSRWQKGKTYEELYGTEKAAEMKQKQRERKIGKNTLRKGKGHKKELIEKYGEEEGAKRFDEFIKKQSKSHRGKKWTEKQHILMDGKKPWNKGKTYKLGSYTEERKEHLKKPHNTKQKRLLENPEIINKIKEMRNLSFSYKRIAEETGINYHLLKNII